MAQAPKYHRGWYVTTLTGLKGKVEDVFKGARGWEYTIVVGGTGARMTVPETSLIREGLQVNNKKGGH